MNIVFMGTPDFSVPTLEKLYNDKNINIKYVITKADSKSNRGQKINISEVKKKAIELNLNILQPEKIKNDTEVINKIKESKPDFIIVVAYGQILSKEILDIPKYACINGHASLLPKYRGASPIQTAILNGDKITGTTSMLMDVGLDTGDILLQKEIEISKKETSDSLFDKLSMTTADIIYETILNFVNIKSIKQDESKMSKSIIIKKEFGLIDFSKETAIEIDRKVRAYNSWPSAYIKENDIIYKIWDVDVLTDCESFQNGKKVFENVHIVNDKNIVNEDYNITSQINNEKNLINNKGVCKLIAKCKEGYLVINEIQKSGKNKLTAKEFINGLK